MAKKIFSMRCSEEFLSKIKIFAKEKDISVATLIRLAIDEYISSHK